MPTTTSTTLDQIIAEKTKISERLARLDADRAKAEIRLTELETAERVLARVGKLPPGRKSTRDLALGAEPSAAGRVRGRPPKAATSKPAGRKSGAPSLGDRVLALAVGKTKQELYRACPDDRPAHVGTVVHYHIRAGRIVERDGKLYAAIPATS